MSDTSGDSSVGANCDAVDTMILDQNNNRSGDQECSQDGDGGESEYSGDNEGDGGVLIEETPLSKRLGYVDIFAMKEKMDGVHAWLKELVNNSPGDHVYVHKSTLRHRKRIMNNMRRCMVDTAPMTAKVCQYMRTAAGRYTTQETNKAFRAAAELEGPINVAMKDLLAQTEFKAKFMDNVRDELLKTDHFPQTNLKAELGKIVKSHLRAAILKRAHEQKEAELLQKLNFDRQKASEEFEEELKGAGLMDWTNSSIWHYFQSTAMCTFLMLISRVLAWLIGILTVFTELNRI